MYGYKKKVNYDFETALLRVRENLGSQGFGVLTEIDMKEKLAEKIGATIDNYVIFGACNPPYANRALEVEKEIGLMLPCNVIIFQDKLDIFVSAIIPSVAMGVIRNEALTLIAKEIEAKLKLVIDSL